MRDQLNLNFKSETILPIQDVDLTRYRTVVSFGEICRLSNTYNTINSCCTCSSTLNHLRLRLHLILGTLFQLLKNLVVAQLGQNWRQFAERETIMTHISVQASSG